ncbi:MAG: Gfo/Idh/MocA family oxidoreductase [Bryobacteraceae bacterium]|nr:Gfo/Idh/MocA family oxidoreductase [Bryobacteraceae bacterium]
MSNETTRRTFGAAGSGAAMGLMFVKPEQVRGTQANSAVSVGLIGCGGRGMHDSGLMAKHEFAKIAAFCDIYDDKLDAARKRYTGAKAYKQYQELLASNVDAVLIATPVYLHPEHFEAAVNARKHIFMEKPAGADAAGCRRVIAAATKADPTKRITVDFQQRYGKDYKHAWQVVRSGELGQIKMVRAAWLGGGPPLRSGHPDKEETMRNWFFYRETSGDIIVEQDCHNFDVVNWFTGMHPVKACGYGGQLMRFKGDVMDNLTVSYEFGNGVKFNYSAHQFGRDTYQDVSETFMCEKGWVNTSRRGVKIFRNGKLEEIETKYDITQDAANAFIDGVRKGELENAAFSAAESTLTAILGREAIYTGEETHWDRIINS